MSFVPRQFPLVDPDPSPADPPDCSFEHSRKDKTAKSIELCKCSFMFRLLDLV